MWILCLRNEWIYVWIRANIHIPKGRTAHQIQRRYRGQQINNYNGKMMPRIAEISYDEDTEQTLLDKMKKPLEIRGWSMDNGVGGWAAVEVEDMEEYKEFMKDYKEIKRAAKNWIKFGF